MRITRYDISTFAEVDHFDLSPVFGVNDPDPFRADGITVDTDSDYAYATDYYSSPSALMRLVKSTVAADIGVGVDGGGSGDGDFYYPMYAAIIEYTSPAQRTNVFGLIIT